LKKDTVFFRQAELLLRVLPSVNEEEVFALKGGTAINFFFRDLPRLSVDIDLTYLPVNDRETALMEIGKALLRILDRVQKTIPGVRTFSKKDREFDAVAGLLIRRGDATIKHNVTYRKIAQDLGVDHGNLYRSLMDDANPEWNTVKRVLDYLGYDFKIIKRKEVKTETSKPSRSRRRREENEHRKEDRKSGRGKEETGKDKT
jgi:DNA-binding phage protein